MLADGWGYSRSGLLMIPGGGSLRPRYDRPVGVDLFAGCGGFSLGCEQAGVHMAAAVECEPNAAMTYMVNLARPGVKIHFDTPERAEKFARHLEKHMGLAAKAKDGAVVPVGSLAGDGWISHQPASVRGCEHFFFADVRNVTGEQILDALGLRRGEVDMVVGGPPCQGFSAAGKRNVMDPRNSLVFEFARLVLEIWPKTFTMENVPAMTTMVTPEGVPVIDALCRVLSDGGFSAYDALKRTMAAQTGTAGAMRRDSGPRRAGRWEDEGEDDEAPENEQLDLFGAMA